MLELDPPEFTGPSTSCDRNNDGNCSSPPRPPTIEAIVAAAISRFRIPVPTAVPCCSSFVVRRSEILAAAVDAHDDDEFEDGRRRSEARNATAFRVTCDSVCRSIGVRPRIPTLADILQKKKSGDCRAPQRGNDLGGEGWRNADTDDADRCDDNNNNDDNDDHVKNFNLSTSQESRSWPQGQGIGSKKPRTRWKDDGDRDRAIIDSLAHLSGTSLRAACVTNVPPIDVSPYYTAYNDENDDDESCYRVIGQSSRAIGNVRSAGREHELDFRRDDDVGNRRDDDDELEPADDRGSREERRFEKFRRDAGNGGERESHYTARFQKPTIANGNNENETKFSTKGPTTTTTTTTTTTIKRNRKKKTSNNSCCGRKYGLLFVLYLLTWPLVCSTNPSGQFISGFTRNPSLGPVENVARHNATQISTLLLSSSISHQRQQQYQQYQQKQQQQQQHYRQLEEEHEAREQLIRDNGHHRRRHEEQQQQQQQQQQQEEQSREEREVEERRWSSSYRDDRGKTIVLESESMHPYNEYSWKVNQINPWLSACDLAGPAPADLQGTCDPPEVPKTCPVACAVADEFADVMEKVKVAGRNCYWSTTTGGKKGTTATTATATSTSTTTTATASMVAAAAVAAVAAESGRFGSSSIRSSGADGGGGGGGGGGGFASEKTRGTDRAKAAGRDGVPTAPEQCLFYLEESHKRDICRDDFGRSSTRSFLTPRENRYWFMSGLRLRHCCDHAVVNALAPGKGGPLENVLNGGEKCVDALDKLLHVDTLAARLHCEFEEVLARYDCAQPYSVIFNCTHCKEAYRKWVCSSLVPYFAHGEPQDLNSSDSWAGSRLRPCRSFCQSVEQRCPYLLPGDRAPAYPTQYAGEPTFLCRDPNIPETGEQAARALHSSEENECCFHACSEEFPGSGICANCTSQLPRRRGKSHDPPTAPRCEINPIQPASTAGEDQESGSLTDNSLEREGKLHDSSREPKAAVSTPIEVSGRRQQGGGTLVCGTGGGVDSIASVSSSDRSATFVLPQLFWLCSILTSVLGNVPTIPALWISRMFLWSSMPFAGDDGRGDDRDHDAAVAAIVGDDGSESRRETAESSQLVEDLVAWLRGLNRASLRYRANWLLRKWGAVERRCESWWWWWWCCWYWWWWRWWRTLANGGSVVDGQRRNKKRRNKKRRRKKGRRSAGVSEGFPEQSIVRSSLARRRCIELFSRRKDPP